MSNEMGELNETSSRQNSEGNQINPASVSGNRS